jgi:hypothetical protein
MLIDINPDSTAPGNNPNNPDCLCDVNSREGCKCSGEHSSQNIDKWVITIEHYINDNSKKKDESKPAKEYQENPNKKKYVERQVVLGSSPFYNDYIDQLSDMLTMIGFNLISIPVSMQMSNGGFQRIGSIRSFDSYTKEFTVSVDENAEFQKMLLWSLE